MSDDLAYSIRFASNHMVAYVKNFDAIVEYWIENNLIYYICPPKMGTNLGVMPVENMNMEHFIPLGEL